jgi:hypothetical protein
MLQRCIIFTYLASALLYVFMPVYILAYAVNLYIKLTDYYYLPKPNMYLPSFLKVLEDRYLRNT